MPTVTFVTEPFVPLATQVAEGLNLPSLTRVTVSHSISAALPGSVREAMAGISGEVSDAIFRKADAAAAPRVKDVERASDSVLLVERLDHPGDDEDAMELYRSRGWTDGLPIVLPSDERVRRMLGAYATRPLTILGQMPPSGAAVTFESLAVCAVMAGCDPSHFPVLIAALNAMLRPEFNLLRLQTTTSAGTPMLIVGGPGAGAVGINGSNDVLGANYRPNITIGRAVRLTMIGIGGATPQHGDMSTLGQSAKVGLCITENVANSPFEPLHVNAGYASDETVVGVIGVCGQMNINDFTSKSAADLLNTISRTIAVPGLYNVQIGGGPLLLLGPEHAAILAAAGFGRTDLQRWLFEHARVPISAFSTETIAAMRARRPNVLIGDDPQSTVPIADDWRDFVILVAGGSGSHSVLMPTVRGRVVFSRVGDEVSPAGR